MECGCLGHASPPGVAQAVLWSQWGTLSTPYFLISPPSPDVVRVFHLQTLSLHRQRLGFLQSWESVTGFMAAPTYSEA